MMRTILASLSLAAVALATGGLLPVASADHTCPFPLDLVVTCGHSQVGDAGVCAALVGCVAYCPGGGFEQCPDETDCYRFFRQADLVQVCLDSDLP